MQPRVLRRWTASISGALLIAASTFVASAPATAADPNTGGLRVISAATADMVEVFAGDLATDDEFSPNVSPALQATLAAAYSAAQVHPDDLAPPYLQGDAVVAPSVTAAGAGVRKAYAPSAKAVSATRSLNQLRTLQHRALSTETDTFASNNLMVSFIQASRNRVVVESNIADVALRSGLARLFGSTAVAIHLVRRDFPQLTADGRQNDNTNYEGGSRFTGSGGCTTGFAWMDAAHGDMMLTAGHCTTNPGLAHSPNGGYMGDVIMDNWANADGGGSVIPAGQSDWHGDVSIIEIEPSEQSSAHVHVGGITSTTALPVNGRLGGPVNTAMATFCSGGAYSGEQCGWRVTQTLIDVHYASTTAGACPCWWARNVFKASKTSGQCIQNGDSGGPLYQVFGGQITAVGIVSGAPNASTGSPSKPCYLYATDIYDAYLATPGDIKKA
jgi:hypothetical protein